MTKPSDTVVMRLELGDLRPPLTLKDVLQLIDDSRGDDHNFSDEFEVFKECLSRPDDNRAEFSGGLKIDDDEVQWDQKGQSGSLRATCEWSSYNGCPDASGYGEEETDITIKLDRKRKVLLFTATKPPEPRSTYEEL